MSSPPRPVRQVSYTGYKDPQIQHEPWCKSPHPNAVVNCTCPASADLSYTTRVEELSVDQYRMLYNPAPIPVHKLKRIRHARHLVRPKNPAYWPRDQQGRPYDPKEYGYPPDWLGENPYGDAREEYVEFDEYGNPTNMPAMPNFPNEHATVRDTVSMPTVTENPRLPVPPPTPRKPSKNYWEVDMQNPQDAQRWHTDPTYLSAPEAEYTPEQIERARRRQLALQGQPAQPRSGLESVSGPASVYPTQFAGLPPEQQQQAYPSTGQPMTPHTQTLCRAPLIVDIPNAPLGSPPAVVECGVENDHPGQPHMARVQPRRTTQVIYITWTEE